MKKASSLSGVLTVLMVLAMACGGSTPTRTPVAMSAPTATPTSGDSPIEFVMENNYALGQDIEIKIRNNGTNNYVYSVYYPACSNLEFYDDSLKPRQIESFEDTYELPPGKFIIPQGTHCDLIGSSEIRPGQEVVLLTWSQRECIKDSWGCGESVPVKAGRYTIVGKFFESKGSRDSGPGMYEVGDQTALNWKFTIGP